MTVFNDQVLTFTVAIATADNQNLLDTGELFDALVDVIKLYQVNACGQVEYIHGKCSLTCERMTK